MSGAYCAHLRVSYRTEPCDGENIRGEVVPNGAVRGWWECDSGCGARFTPNAEVLIARLCRHLDEHIIVTRRAAEQLSNNVRPMKDAELAIQAARVFLGELEIAQKS